MLKIKDNIDFSELVQMDFKYDDNDGRFKYCERNIDGATYIYINKWNRKIIYRQDKVSDTLCLFKLYELIKNGLVEIIKE